MSEPRSWLEVSAGKTASIPVVSLLLGVIAGLVRVRLSGAADIEAIWIVAKNGLVGSILGMGAAMVVAGGLRYSLTTVRGLSRLAVVTAVVLIFLISIP